MSEAPSPLPERAEPRHPDPGLRTLTVRDYGAVFVRAGKEALDDHLTNLAAALAYYAFLAIPALLLVAVGAFSLFAGPDAVTSIVERLSGVMPREAVTLVHDALLRVTEQQAGAGVTMTVVGLVLALWTLTGAIETLMWALNEAYDREETRGFLKRRLTGLAMVLLLVLSFALAFGLLVLGPHLSGWMGSAVGAEALVQWLWWTAQWPILLLGLLLAFATILYLGPDVDHPRWSFLTIGTVFAVLDLARGVGCLRRVHEQVRLLRQNLGLPRDRDRHAHLALAQLPRAARRSRSQRRSRTVPRTTPRRARRDDTHRTAEGITA